MNKNDFLHFIENPHLLTREDSVLLADLVKEFPYFNAAQILLAKSFKIQSNYNFDKQLKMASLFAGNRTRLFEFIHREFVPETTKAPTQGIPEQIEENIDYQTSLLPNEEEIANQTAEVTTIHPEKTPVIEEENTRPDEKPEAISHSTSEEKSFEDIIPETFTDQEEFRENAESALTTEEETGPSATPFENTVPPVSGEFTIQEESTTSENENSSQETEKVEKATPYSNAEEITGTPDNYFKDENETEPEIESETSEAEETITGETKLHDEDKEEDLQSFTPEPDNIVKLPVETDLISELTEQTTHSKTSEFLEKQEENIKIEIESESPISIDETFNQLPEPEKTETTQDTDLEGLESAEQQPFSGQPSKAETTVTKTELKKDSDNKKTEELSEPEELFFQWLTKFTEEPVKSLGETKEIQPALTEEKGETTVEKTPAEKYEPPVENETPLTEKPAAESGKIDKEEKKDFNPDLLIEKFLIEQPSISKPQATFYNPANMAKQSEIPAMDLATETLAKIYLKQGHVKKAINIYEKLSLQKPEKFSYFADQILKIKKENNLE